MSDRLTSIELVLSELLGIQDIHAVPVEKIAVMLGELRKEDVTHCLQTVLDSHYNLARLAVHRSAIVTCPEPRCRRAWKAGDIFDTGTCSHAACPMKP